VRDVADRRRRRSIRESALVHRRRAAWPPNHVDPDEVPIIVERSAPYVFHPAHDEDIREVLRRLPCGSLDGLGEVRLCLYLGDSEWGPRVRDPFTGRLRRELVPGVFGPSVLGTYTFSTAGIRIHAWLCGPHVAVPIAIFLKVESLRTLVHEVAHHFDRTFRRGRPRWDVNERERDEAWAERIEDEHALGIVIPYVVEQYRSECEELAGWVAEHGGAAIDPFELVDAASRPFLDLVRSVLVGRPRNATRALFARSLHRIGANVYARSILRELLSRRPDDARALAVSACIAQCEAKDFGTAEQLSRRALAADPACMEAWDALVRGYAIRRMWREAAGACESAIACAPVGEDPPRYILDTLEQARGRLDEAIAPASRAVEPA